MGQYRKHHLQRAHHQTEGFWKIYPLSLLFTFHLGLVAYINALYLAQFIPAEKISLLYAAGSVVSILSFIFFNTILRLLGNLRLTILLAALEIMVLVTLGLTESATIAVIAFLGYLVIIPLIYLNIDIFSETLIGEDEESTGGKRGLTLSLMNGALAAAPLAMSFIVGFAGQSAVYLTSAGVITILLLYVLLVFKDFEDQPYPAFAFMTGLRKVWHNRDVRHVMAAHFCLQMFFAFMVVFFYLYLERTTSLSWEQIGLITAVGLSAYVLFEWPTGMLADRWLGEKELMALGFFILAISTSWIAFMHTSAILPWMIVLFASRTAAALCEATTEIYFFKHTEGSDSDLMDFFRLLRPSAYVCGLGLGTLALMFLPFNLLFVFVGMLMLPAIYFTSHLRDTK